MYTLQKCKNQTCQKQHEKYQLQVKITYNHNHKVLSNTNFDFCRVSDKTEDEIISIFKSGKGPAKAMRLYRKNLKTEIGNLGYLKIAANRSINPDRNFYFNLFTKYWKKELGSINGPDATKKAYEMIKQYNRENGENLASISFTDGQEGNREVVLVVIDKVVQRVHQLVPQSGDIVYVDGTGSLDRTDTQLFKLMTCSPAGGLLGFSKLHNYSLQPCSHYQK